MKNTPPAADATPSTAPAAAGTSKGKAKGLSALPIAAQEKVLLTRIQTLFDSLFTTEPVFQVGEKTGPIDVAGSFLSRPDDLDFFDTNENGEIVLPSRPIPMFPEDFGPGEREHPLSWWGIMDPDLGKGKYPTPPSEREGYP